MRVEVCVPPVLRVIRLGVYENLSLQSSCPRCDQQPMATFIFQEQQRIQLKFRSEQHLQIVEEDRPGRCIGNHMPYDPPDFVRVARTRHFVQPCAHTQIDIE